MKTVAFGSLQDLRCTTPTIVDINANNLENKHTDSMKEYICDLFKIGLL